MYQISTLPLTGVSKSYTFRGFMGEGKDREGYTEDCLPVGAPRKRAPRNKLLFFSTLVDELAR